MRKFIISVLMSLFLGLVTMFVGCGESKTNVELEVPQSIEVVLGKDTKLETKVKGTDEKIIFTSNDESVAVVTEEGIIKGKKAGSCKIIVKVLDVEKECQVTVKLHSEAPVLTLNDTNINLHLNDVFSLNAKLTHLNKEVENILKYESLDTTKVTVDENGKIKAIALGQTKIKVFYSYLGFNETQEVTVNVIEDIEMKASDDNVELVVKNYSTSSTIPTEIKVDIITLKLNGEDIVTPNIIWESEDDKVATVENGLIKAVGKGNTLVKAKYVSSLGTTSDCIINVVVDKEKINSRVQANTDATWDYGFKEVSDKMYLNIPSSLNIEEKDILSIKYTETDVEIGEKGSFWINKTDFLGLKPISIETNEFIFNLELNVETSVKNIYTSDFNTNSFLSTNPHVEEVEEFEGKKKVIKTQSLGPTAEYEDIWYNHNGLLSLKNIGIKESRGYLVMDVWTSSDKVKLGGYLYGYIRDENGKRVKIDNYSFRYNTKVENAFDRDIIKVVDIDTNEHTVIQSNKWVRIIIDFTSFCAGYDENEVMEINFYPSFARGLKDPDPVWEAYIANMEYMTEDAYLSRFKNIQQYTVSFETYSNQKVEPIKFDKFSTLNELPTINVADNEFLYWEYDGRRADGMKLFDNITLTAAYSKPVNYEVVTYKVQENGEPLEIDRKLLTGKVGEKVSFNGEILEGYLIKSDLSILEDTLRLDNNVVLKVYLEKEIVVGRTYDGSIFTKEAEAKADFLYIKESYGQIENLYHYKKSGNTDPFGYMLTYDVKAEDLGKYMVVKVMVPNNVTTQKIKFNLWQASSNVSTKYFNVYSSFGKFITEIKVNEWYNCSFYLDPNIISEGQIELSFANWVPDAEYYIDTITFMDKSLFETNFDLPLSLNGEGVSGQSPYNNIKFISDSSTSNVEYFGNYAYISTKESGGMDDRKFSLKYNKNYPNENYLVFTVNFQNKNSSGIDMRAIQGGASNPWVHYDFYDKNFNFVEKADRQINEWYYVVSTTTGHNTPASDYHNQYAFTDWAKPNVYIGCIYSITPQARENLFLKNNKA